MMPTTKQGCSIVGAELSLGCDSCFIVFFRKKDQRSQKLTLTAPKSDKTRGIKVNTRTQKFKSQYVSSANWSVSQKHTKAEWTDVLIWIKFTNIQAMSPKYFIQNLRKQNINRISIRIYANKQTDRHARNS